MDRRMLVAALTSAALLSMAGGASAQSAGDFPNHPIRIIVPQAAGSGIDLQARTLAQKMTELLGQPGIIENRPGANAIIGTDAVAKSAPDGYTLVYAPVSAVTTNVLIYKKLPYDPVRDFAPITQTVANPLGLIANPDSGINSIKDLVDRAKANPGKINFGSFGIGNLTHLQGVLLSLAAKIEMTHVPYRGQTPEITDIMAGQIPVGFTTTAGASEIVASGKLKLLATFGATRDELFPNTPTPTEAGYPNVVVVGWAGILAPGGTPKPIVDKLYAAFAKALAMPDVKEAILKQGSEPVASKSADDFHEYIKAEIEKYRPVIKAAGLEGSQ